MSTHTLFREDVFTLSDLRLAIARIEAALRSEAAPGLSSTPIHGGRHVRLPATIDRDGESTFEIMIRPIKSA